MVRIPQGGDAMTAFEHSARLTVLAEAIGYHRYWVAENHNVPGFASGATAIVLAHIAAASQSIRVGAGAINLPNHAPLMVAEQFGTLARLYPGRIDLGLGRGDGAIENPKTTTALRRRVQDVQAFPESVVEVQAMFRPTSPPPVVQAVTATGANVPIYIVGSGVGDAMLAAELGLPYTHSAHLSADTMLSAISTYRERFEPSRRLARPHVMISVNVAAAATDREARRLEVKRREPLAGTPRIHGLEASHVSIDPWSSIEQGRRKKSSELCISGSPATVRSELASLARETQADEVITVTDMHTLEARMSSLRIFAECARALLD
jgi:luciferase family oxidoreductase group 1